MFARLLLLSAPRCSCWRHRYPVPVVYGRRRPPWSTSAPATRTARCSSRSRSACFAAIVAGQRRAAWAAHRHALGRASADRALAVPVAAAVRGLRRRLGAGVVVAAWVVAIVAVVRTGPRTGASSGPGSAPSGSGRQAPRRRGAAADRPRTARRPRPQHLRHQRPGGRRPRPARLRPGTGPHRAHHHQGREQGGARRGPPGPRHPAHPRRRAARPRAGPRPAARTRRAGRGRGPHRGRRGGGRAPARRPARTSPPSGSSRRRSPTSYGTPVRGTRACGSRYDADALELRVDDDGPATGATRAAAATVSPECGSGPPPWVARSRRARAPDGGFRVLAVLPREARSPRRTTGDPRTARRRPVTGPGRLPGAARRPAGHRGGRRGRRR